LQIGRLSGKLRGEKVNIFLKQKFESLINLSFAAVDIAVLLLLRIAFALLSFAFLFCSFKAGFLTGFVLHFFCSQSFRFGNEKVK